jgi:hypothetical protein
MGTAEDLTMKVRSSISTVGGGLFMTVSGRNGFGRTSQVYLFDTSGHTQPSIEAPSQPSKVVFDKNLQPTIAPRCSGQRTDRGRLWQEKARIQVKAAPTARPSHLLQRETTGSCRWDMRHRPIIGVSSRT